jgi:opacity protein-like surface antigen
VLDTNYLPVSITTGKSVASPYQFKNNVGVGLTGGVGVYYKLTDLLHVLAEPYFRYNLKPMSKEALTLQQKYNTIGVRLGVRLDLK